MHATVNKQDTLKFLLKQTKRETNFKFPSPTNTKLRWNRLTWDVSFTNVPLQYYCICVWNWNVKTVISVEGGMRLSFVTYLDELDDRLEHCSRSRKTWAWRLLTKGKIDVKIFCSHHTLSMISSHSFEF